MCHIIECDTIGRRPWLERFGLRLPAARRGYRREAHYGDHSVSVRPFCASQSVTPIDPTHEPTEGTLGLLGLPMSVLLPVELAYIGGSLQRAKRRPFGEIFSYWPLYPESFDSGPLITMCMVQGVPRAASGGRNYAS